MIDLVYNQNNNNNNNNNNRRHHYEEEEEIMDRSIPRYITISMDVPSSPTNHQTHSQCDESPSNNNTNIWREPILAQSPETTQRMTLLHPASTTFETSRISLGRTVTDSSSSTHNSLDQSGRSHNMFDDCMSVTPLDFRRDWSDEIIQCIKTHPNLLSLVDHDQRVDLGDYDDNSVETIDMGLSNDDDDFSESTPASPMVKEFLRPTLNI